MKQYRYSICNVFTRQAFGGNPLAVIDDARGLSSVQMQQIARQFNFSETTFVLPAEADGDYKVKIFTPSREVPFAGHPNVGTAFVLQQLDKLVCGEDGAETTFEEGAGLVKVSLAQQPGQPLSCEITAPEPLTLSTPLPVELVAQALDLEASSIVTEVHPPQVASVGLPFVMVQLASEDDLARAQVNAEGFQRLADMGLMPDIHLYVREEQGTVLNTRMFAPLDGVPEDPATGSANAALVAMLSHYQSLSNGETRWQISQGVQMGRPSELLATTVKRFGRVEQVRIAGYCQMFAQGQLQISV